MVPAAFLRESLRRAYCLRRVLDPSQPGDFYRREAQTRGSSSGRTFAGATRLSDAPLEHLERTRWDPKDSELCLTRAKPGETPVEARSDSDVQIDRQS